MSYSLKFEHPHFPADQEFGINDLGVVKNGGTLELDEDQERVFVASRGKTVEDAFKDNKAVTLSGSTALSAEETQTLLPASEEVTVEQQPQMQVQENTPNEQTPPQQENQGGEM